MKRKLMILMGFLVVLAVLASNICYYQFQDSIQSYSVVDNEDPENGNSNDDTLIINPATSSISSSTLSSTPLYIIGETYTLIKNKVEILKDRIGSRINFLKILTHCIVPVNAP